MLLGFQRTAHGEMQLYAQASESRRRRKAFVCGVRMDGKASQRVKCCAKAPSSKGSGLRAQTSQDRTFLARNNFRLARHLPAIGDKLRIELPTFQHRTCGQWRRLPIGSASVQ